MSRGWDLCTSAWIPNQGHNRPLMCFPASDKASTISGCASHSNGVVRNRSCKVSRLGPPEGREVFNNKKKPLACRRDKQFYSVCWTTRIGTIRGSIRKIWGFVSESLNSPATLFQNHYAIPLIAKRLSSLFVCAYIYLCFIFYVYFFPWGSRF